MRSRATLVSRVVVSVVVGVLAAAVAPGSPASLPAAGAAAPPAPGSITLSVLSARSVADGPGFVQEGRRRRRHTSG